MCLKTQSKRPGTRLIRIDDFLAPIASFVQTKRMDAVPDQWKVDILRTSSMENCATKDAALAAWASFVPEAPDCTSSEGSSEEGTNYGRSRRAHHCSQSCNRKDRSDRSSDSDLTASKSDTVARRKELCSRCIVVKCVKVHRIQIPMNRPKGHITRKTTPKIIDHVNDCFREALDIQLYLLANTFGW